MQNFKIFEDLLRRIRGKRTRRRAVLNLIVFCLIASVLGIFAVYYSSYFKTRAEVDARRDPSPGIRVEYQVFVGPSAIYAASRKGLVYSESSGFENGGRWWRNDVMRAAEQWLHIRGIYSKNANSLPNGYFNASVNDSRGRSIYTETYYDDNTPIGGRKFFGLPTTEPRLPLEVRMQDFLSHAVESENWEIDVYDQELSDGKISQFAFDSYSVNGFASAEYVKGKTGDKWTEKVVLKNPGLVDLVKSRISFVHSAALLFLETRQVCMLVLSVENISERAIYNPTFWAKLTPGEVDGSLKCESEMKEESAVSRLVKMEMPIDAFKPGEKIHVPLSLFMEFEDEGRAKESNWKDFPKDRAYFEVLVGASPNGDAKIDRMLVDLRSLKRRGPVQSKNRKYFFGPEILPERIEIDSPATRTFLIRKYDPLNIILHDGDEKGSCPVLFSLRGEEAKRIRPILVNSVTRSAHSTDLVKVDAGEDSFEIHELDAERSFITGCFLMVELSDGSEIRYEPIGLAPISGNKPKILDQGDKLAFQFETSHDRTMEISRTLGISGYYVPYSIMNR